MANVKSMMSYQSLPLPGDREADEQNTPMFREYWEHHHILCWGWLQTLLCGGNRRITITIRDN